MGFCPGSTYISSMIDQSVAEIASFFRRNDLPQSHLHLLRFFYIIHQTHAVRQPDTMCIRHNSRFSEYIPHDQIGALSSHSRKLLKRVKVFGNLSSVFIPEHPHTSADISGFTVTQSAGLHNGFYIRHIRIS